MRNANDVLVENLLSCFEGIGMSAEQTEKVDEYLRSKGFARADFDLGIGRGTLNLHDPAYKNLAEKMRKQFFKLDKHIDDGLYSRFFDVAFQVFGVSMEAGLGFYKLLKSGVKYDQGLAITVLKYCTGNWIYPNNFKNVYALIKESKKDLGVIKKAIEYNGNDYRVIQMLYSCLIYDGPGYESVGRICFKDEAKGGEGLFKSLLGGLKNMVSGAGGDDRRITAKKPGEYTAEFETLVQSIKETAYTVFTPALTDAEQRLLTEYISEPENFEKEIPAEIKSLFGLGSGHALIEQQANRLIPIAALNYRKSSVLANFLRVCMNTNTTMLCNILGRAEYKDDMRDEALRWYYDLTPDAELFIRWLASKKYEKTMKFMAENEPEGYLAAIRSADMANYPLLVKLTTSTSKEVYQKYYANVASSGQDEKKEDIINDVCELGIAKDGTDLKAVARAIILGERPYSDIFPYVSEIEETAWRDHNRIINPYIDVYGDDEFVKNVIVFLALRGGTGTINSYSHRGRSYNDADYGKIVDILEERNIDVAYQYRIFAGMYDNFYGNNKTLCEKIMKKHFARKLVTDPEKTLEAFKNSSVTGRVVAVSLIDKSTISNKKEELLSYVSDSSKQVRAELIPLLEKHSEWAPEYVALLSSKKAGEREIAAGLLAKCKGDYSAELKAALEKEKNAKAMAAISAALNGADAATAALAGTLGTAAVNLDAEGKLVKAELTADQIAANLLKGGKKRSLEWIYSTGDMPVVHYAKDENSTEPAKEATTEYLQAILVAYSSMPNPGVNNEAKTLAAPLDKNELALFMNEVYERFMKNGAEAKKKWVLYAAGIHGGASMVPVLKKQVDEWAAASRGAIAAEAIRALALNDSPTALLIVDNISRKYKFKQVRKAAGDALKFAAEQLGLTVDELSDRIVPDLDFNERGERVFDYGERSFTVRITPALDIIITNNEGKAVKSMPAPGKSDDEAKANEAYAAFKEMKTQMKTVVKNQGQRLEMALSSNRLWAKEDWEKLFVKNPIMHQFAISLIWAVYENGSIVKTFRFMEDGTFNTVDEDEYELPEGAKIGLIHPVEITEEEKSAWLTQLDDYEIKQVIPQLARPVYLIEEAEKNEKKLARFNGAEITDVTLTSRLTGLGWEKGTPMDAGVFDVFYRADRDAGYCVELAFSGAYIGGGYDYSESVDVEDVTFYPYSMAGKMGWQDKKKEADALKLSDIPARYFSEIIYQLTKATTT